jgi:hypothetical protein
MEEMLSTARAEDLNGQLKSPTPVDAAGHGYGFRKRNAGSSLLPVAVRFDL